MRITIEFNDDKETLERVLKFIADNKIGSAQLDTDTVDSDKIPDTEYVKFKVLSYGTNLIGSIKMLRMELGTGLKESKELAEGITGPITIRKEVALKLKEELRSNFGATVIIS